MTEGYVKYKKAEYKYQTAEEYQVQTSIRPPEDIENFFIALTKDGLLTIRRGYAWDGPSGPTFDTKTFICGSLGHDAIYQLIREGLLSSDWRKNADMDLKKTCLKDGMIKQRAWWVYRGVVKFAGFAVKRKRRKKVLIAP